MPRSYPPEFRRRVIDLVESGRSVAVEVVGVGLVESAERELVDDQQVDA